MRKLALLAAVVCLICCYGMTAWSQPSEVESGLSRYQGPSSATTNGNAGGILGMNQLCQDTYGATAHICTLDQFYWTAAAKPTVALPTMWIMPSYHNCVYSTLKSEVLCQLGVSPQWFVPNQSVTTFECNAWGSATGFDQGLAVSFTAGTSTVTQEPCNIKQPVACCAP
jgi:hypothetical protein